MRRCSPENSKTSPLRTANPSTAGCSSSVPGPVKRSSDFDIGIQGLGEDDFRHVKDKIVEEAEEANILHDVDVVNFDTLEDPMLSHAAQTVEVWKDWDGNSEK